ncbi:MAG: hypothetical protein EPN99_07170 [Frankiales bacterium]|nr:MAG: hypothetical protein EPN99_07170 [Frankiales bacterium]
MRALAGRLRVRLVAVVAAAALAGPLGVLAAAGQAPDPTRCADEDAVTRIGSWEAVRAPAFTVRPGGRGATVTTFAVHPAQPATRFATNGTSVERTDDGGCSWREVYALPDVPTEEDTLAVATAQVVELVVPLDPRGDDRLVLVVRDGNGGPRVLASEDGGREEPFRDRSEGLPATGTPSDLLIATTNPEFLFLAVSAVAPDGPAGGAGLPVPLPDLPMLPVPGTGDTTPTSPGALFGSVDGGLTWEPRVDVADLGGSTTGIDLLAGHPTSPNRLWAVSDGLLRASEDGGRTFGGSAPPLEEQRRRGWGITALVADRLPDDSLLLLGFSASSAQDGGPVVLSSEDGGTTFDETPAPGVVDAAAPFLPGTGKVVLSTVASSEAPADVHLVSVRRGVVPSLLRSVGPSVDAGDLQVTADQSSSPTFHARTSDALLRYVGPAAAVPDDLPPLVGGVVSDALPPVGDASLTPARDEVRLQVGESTTVQHRLVPPRRPSPLDLFLVVDTTESMADDLDRVRADLLAMVAGLESAGLSVSVGLGEFKGGASSLAYRRVTGVGPGREPLRADLASLVADGSGLEAQLIALEQALEGRGEAPSALLPTACGVSASNPDRFVQGERRSSPPVLPGQQADFRRGSVPVVVLVTDTNFLRPDGTRLKPDCTVDVTTVAQRYARAGVHVVGVGIDDVDNPQRAADLLELARTTGAMQPAGRACAPAIDPAPGGAGVCRTATELVPTLSALATRPTEPLSLDVVEVPDSAVLTAPDRLQVDLRRGEPVDLPVTYTCSREGDAEAALEVRLGATAVARLTSRVVCLPLPSPSRPDAVVAAVPLVGLLPPAPLPPPAPPAQAVQPQVQTQPQAQAQTQVQSGTQDQEQAAAQLALALQSGMQDEGLTTQAMSAREVPDVVRLSLLAAVTAAAGVVAVRRREAVAVRPSATRR